MLLLRRFARCLSHRSVSRALRALLLAAGALVLLASPLLLLEPTLSLDIPQLPDEPADGLVRCHHHD